MQIIKAFVNISLQQSTIGFNCNLCTFVCVTNHMAYDYVPLCGFVCEF